MLRHLQRALCASLLVGLCAAKFRDHDEDPMIYEKEVKADKLQDDDQQALQALQKRIAENTTSRPYAIVMVTGESEIENAKLSIPVWQKYAEYHGHDFFIVQRRLSTTNTLRFEWTQPRALMELNKRTKWKYMWVVHSDSLPLQFNESWTYAIKHYLRDKCYLNDKPKERVVYCPKDCEPGGKDHLQEGTCYGPILTGCIFWTAKPQKKKTGRILKEWYAKRHRMGPIPDGLRKAFDDVKTKNWDSVYWHESQMEIGRHDSTFMASFRYSPEHKWNTRQMLASTIKKIKILGDKANEFVKESDEFKPEL
jgi:hypothetical protein